MGARSESQVYTYDGKMMCSLSLSVPSSCMASVSNDYVALLDPDQKTTVRFFNLPNGQEAAKVLSACKSDEPRRLVRNGGVAVMDLVSISLSQGGTQVDPLLTTAVAATTLGAGSGLRLCRHPAR